MYSNGRTTDPPKAPGSALRDIAMGLLQLTRELGHDVQIRSIVADTNVLLRDLGYYAKTGRQTTLLAEADSGFVRILVTPQIIEEVTRNIPTYAKNVRLDPAVLIAGWSAYQRSLIIIDLRPPRQTS